VIAIDVVYDNLARCPPSVAGLLENFPEICSFQ